MVLAAGTIAFQQPQQIHIGLGMVPSEISVHWTTIQACGQDGCPKYSPGESSVQYGTDVDNLSLSVEGSNFLFHAEGSEKRNYTMHIATMTNLQPGTEYFYIVGGQSSGWSTPYSFRTVPATGTRPFVYGVFGDMGDYNGQSLPSLQEAARRKELDMILHTGDFAYNFDNDNGRNGDEFMRDLEPIAATTPYMVSLGNHESSANFNHYTQRFRNMPSNSGTINFPEFGEVPNNWWYSWDHGLVHFVAVSTEVYFDYPDMVAAQWEWVKADLEAANKNRQSVPWIVVHGHRPLYCSCDGDCDSSASTVRMGLKNGTGFHYGLEELFYQNGVDLYVCGHEHDYERMFDVAPQYNAVLPYLSGKTTRSTTNPPATTYIVTGSAGSVEEHEPFIRPRPRRSAARLNTFGWSRMTVHNASHLYWEQIQTDNGQPPATWNSVVDSVWLVQEHHGSFKDHPRVNEPAREVTEEELKELEVQLAPASPNANLCRHTAHGQLPECSGTHDGEAMARLGGWQYTKARAQATIEV